MGEHYDLLSLVQVNLDATPVITKTATETAAAMETKVSLLRTSIDDQLAEERTARDAELKSLPTDERQQLRKLEERIWNDRRRALIKETQEANQDAVEKHLQQLHKHKAQLISLHELVGDSPAHLLTTLGVTGSERSGVLMKTVEGAQPGLLAQLARKAIADRDVELGTAITLRLSAMDSRARPVSVQDLSRALVGERYDALSRSIHDALDHVEDGLQTAGRWLVGRDASPTEKIERGLRHHAKQAIDKKALGKAVRGRAQR